jgi:hypothetical protein
MEWDLHFLLTTKEACKVLKEGGELKRYYWKNILNDSEAVEKLNTIAKEAEALFTKNGLKVADFAVHEFGLEFGVNIVHGEFNNNISDEEFDRLETEALISWKFICSKHKVLPIEMHSEEHKEISFD